jgi:hypothetical protein
MHIQSTHHQVVAYGADRMVLADSATCDPIVIAERAMGPDGPIWVVGAADVSNVCVQTRPEAITTMAEMALAVLPGEGYTTLVPHGLAELP